MPEKLNQKVIESAVLDYKQNGLSIVACAKKHNIGATTLTRYLHKEGINTSNYDTRKYSYNQDYFSVIDTEEKAYWLGFIAADGSIVNNRTALEISLSRNDKNHLYKFLTAVQGEEGMIKDREQKAGTKRYPSSRITICSVKMVSDLNNHGIIERKGFLLGFPKLQGDMLRHYLRGYFDGDGSISTNGTYRKGNPKYAINLIATESFLEDFIIHMMDLGITRVSLQNKGPMRSWNKVGINQISIVLNYLYNDSNVYLDRKYQYAREICRPISTLQKK